MKYVIDCSSALPAYVAENLTPKALSIRDDYLRSLHELIAPDFITTEMSNTLIVSERRGRIPKGDATRLFTLFLTQLPVLHPVWPNILPRAHAIAETTIASVYDSLYVALAEIEGCELITGDDKLVRNLQGKFPFIKSLSTF